MNLNDTVAGETYKGRPINEIIIEMSIKQDQILIQLQRIEENMQDLENRKANKTEFDSYEARLLALERNYSNYEKDKWKIFGIASGIALVGVVVSQIYTYIK